MAGYSSLVQMRLADDRALAPAIMLHSRKQWDSLVKTQEEYDVKLELLSTF